MHFKNRLATGNFLTSTNLIIVVCFITATMLLWKNCTGEKKITSGKNDDREVIRIAIPRKMPFQSKPEKSPQILATAVPAPETCLAGTFLKTGTTEKRNASSVIGNIWQVGKRESLSIIAGKEDVYGDPLKWPSLYRLNAKELDAAGIKISDDFQNKFLPEGLSLRFIRASEAKIRGTKIKDKAFVVNVLSTVTPNTVVLPAVSLIKKGYYVYIISAEIKGKSWLRLRVGFYEDRVKATAAGKGIMALLGLKGAWVTKIEKDEFRKVGGY